MLSLKKNKYTNTEMAVWQLWNANVAHGRERFALPAVVLKEFFGRRYCAAVAETFVRGEEWAKGELSKTLEPIDASDMHREWCRASRGRQRAIDALAKNIRQAQLEYGKLQETIQVIEGVAGFDLYNNQKAIAEMNGIDDFVMNRPGERAGNRMFTSFLAMPSNERQNLILRHGQGNIAIDLKASFLSMAAVAMAKEGLGEYGLMVKNLAAAAASFGPKAERVQAVGKLLNFPLNGSSEALEAVQYVEGWEAFPEWLRANAKGKWQGETLQQKLTELEQDFMLSLCKELNSLCVPFIYEYDGLTIASSDSGIVRDLALKVWLRTFRLAVSSETFNNLLFIAKNVPKRNKETRQGESIYVAHPHTHTQPTSLVEDIFKELDEELASFVFRPPDKLDTRHSDPWLFD